LEIGELDDSDDFEAEEVAKPPPGFLISFHPKSSVLKK